MTDESEIDWRVKMGAQQVNLFYQNPEMYTRMLVRNSGMREVLVKAYQGCVEEQLIIPIDRVSKEEKVKFWENAKKEAAGSLSVKDCTKLAKALYTINCFLNQ